MAVISKRRVKRFWDKSDLPEATTNEKGKALEDLICYIFEKVPGITVTARNETNLFDSEEVDVVFWNDKDSKALAYLPHLIFVECKNWSLPIGSAQVRDFESKLRGKGLSFGVIVAANGITGDQTDRTGAHHTIDRALADQRQIIVITRHDIESLTSSDQLVRMIKEKICRLYVVGNVL